MNPTTPPPPNDNEIRLERHPGGGIKMSIPASVMPQLSEWAGRLQRELSIPIETDDVVVAYILATDKLKKQSLHRTADGYFVPLEDFFELLKVEAVRVYEMR